MAAGSAERRRIGSAAELMSALNDPDPLARLGLWRHIARSPEKALSYGAHEGRDVLDTLIAQVDATLPSQMRHAAVLTIANFGDPRAIAFLMRDLPTNTDTESVMAIIVRLAEETTEPVRLLLVEMLERDARSAHARTAANVLAWWPDWQPDLRQWLRMALLSDVGRPEPPPFDEATADLWLEHLSGPTGRRAWQMLELQGEEAFLQMASRWDGFDDSWRLALLQWAGRHHPSRVPPLLGDSLCATDVPLVVEALRLLAVLAEAQPLHQDVLQALWQHPRLDVRCAVLRAGLRDVDWEAAIEASHEVALQAELLTAYARHCPDAATARLLVTLEAPQWQLRAVATQLLIQAGDAALEGARARYFHAEPEVRLAACQVLIGLDQHEWLEEAFLEAPVAPGE